MKLLLDHNLSPKLVRLLAEEFTEVVHVMTLGMADDCDIDIWDYAQDKGYTIVSKDKDFYQRSALLGQPPKVIHVALGNCSVGDVATVLLNNPGQVKDFLKHKSKAYLVLPQLSVPKS